MLTHALLRLELFAELEQVPKMLDEGIVDKDLMLVLAKQDYRTLRFASDELKGDKSFMMPLILSASDMGSTSR